MVAEEAEDISITHAGHNPCRSCQEAARMVSTLMILNLNLQLLSEKAEMHCGESLNSVMEQCGMYQIYHTHSDSFPGDEGAKDRRDRFLCKT